MKHWYIAANTMHIILSTSAWAHDKLTHCCKPYSRHKKHWYIVANYTPGTHHPREFLWWKQRCRVPPLWWRMSPPTGTRSLGARTWSPEMWWCWRTQTPVLWWPPSRWFCTRQCGHSGARWEAESRCRRWSWNSSWQWQESEGILLELSSKKQRNKSCMCVSVCLSSCIQADVKVLLSLISNPLSASSPFPSLIGLHSETKMFQNQLSIRHREDVFWARGTPWGDSLDSDLFFFVQTIKEWVVWTTSLIFSVHNDIINQHCCCWFSV